MATNHLEDGSMQLKFPVVLAVAIGLAALYTLIQKMGSLIVELSDIIFVLVSGACSLFAYLVVRRWGIRGKLGLVRTGFFLAVLLWFLGEAVWTIYEVFFQIPIPYPSLADLFYLAGYFPATLGILMFLSVFGKELKGLKIVFPALLGMLIIGLTYVLLLNPLMKTNTDALTQVFDVAYPSLDAILLTLALLMFLVFEGSIMSSAWLWISLGLLLTTLADIAFSLGTLQGWYYSGHPIELMYLWGYLSLAVGFDGQRKEFGQNQP